MLLSFPAQYLLLMSALLHAAPAFPMFPMPAPKKRLCDCPEHNCGASNSGVALDPGDKAGPEGFSSPERAPPNVAVASRERAPPNVAVHANFESARRELGSESPINTFVIERGIAGIVPAEAFDTVATPLILEVYLLDPMNDAQGTQEIMLGALDARLRGLSKPHKLSLSRCIAEIAAEYALCCASDSSSLRSTRQVKAVKAKLCVSSVGDSRNAQPCPRFHRDR